MTEEDLLTVIRRGAERLSQIPTAHRDHALNELRTAIEKLASSVGYTPDDGSSFADELVEMLTVAAIQRRASPPNLH